MIKIPIVKSDQIQKQIIFSHFNQDARAGLWKKENLIVRDTVKINVFMEGDFSVFSDETLHYPIYGDICVFPPRKMHYGQISKPTHINYYQIDLGVDAFNMIPDGRCLIERLLEAVADGDSFVRGDQKNGKAVLSVFGEIENHIRCDEMALAFTKVVEAISLLTRVFLHEAAVPAVSLSMRTAEVLAYIKAHYAEEVSVSEIAVSVGVSSSYLSRIFKKEIGMGIHEYLNQYRVMRATELLQSHSVTDTGYLCGFCDSAHFIAVFKKHMHVTPMNYKKTFSKDL